MMIDYQSLADQNEQLLQEIKRLEERLEAVSIVAASVSQSLDLPYVLRTALQAVVEITSAEAAGISLIDEATGEVVLSAQQGWINDFVSQRSIRVPFGMGMSGRVIAADDAIVWNDLSQAEELAVPSFREEPFQSIVMTPMHARGKIVGLLSLMSRYKNAFDDAIVGVLKAISDTVGVALDNARLYEQTVENQNRLSAILRSSADGIIATDQEGRIQLFNTAARAMLDAEAELLIGVPLREAPLPAAVLEALLFALAGHGDEAKRTFQVSLPNERVLSVIVSPVYVDRQLESNAMMDGWVVVLQDVTHLHQAEIARTQFIQAAAHDMRNPLGVALNSLEQLHRAYGDDDYAVEMIRIANTGITRIDSLLKDLLNLEQIQSGYGFKLTEVDIRDVVEQTAGDIWHILQDHRLKFRVELEPDIPLLTMDQRWVSRAITNYLDNAIKYTPPSGLVVLRAYTNESMLHIEVADDGPGIPADAQARIFERFYRLDGTSHIPGTGLGLAIVKSVAEAHGGTVYLLSEPGQGSTFGLTLQL
ncbi:MAG: ATP-binding protein [bacterium]|nr:ATP-binding protein [bacterium]